MNKWSKASQERLRMAHPDLQKLCRVVLQIHDCSVICARRGPDEQNEAYRAGKSKLQYPHSPHNKVPARAVDLAPYPLDWKNTKRCYYFAGIVTATATALGIAIRWGGDWDSDQDLDDQGFNDLCHFELEYDIRAA